MFNMFTRFRRASMAILLAMMAMFCLFADFTQAAATKLRGGADPTIIKIGDTYYSANSAGGSIYVSSASSIEGLGSAEGKAVWNDAYGLGEVWAPEISTDPSTGWVWIHFAAGVGEKHRMYAITSDEPLGTYDYPQHPMYLPDDKWAIDGAMFTFEGQRYFVWSGWEGDGNGEQSLFICRMDSPRVPSGQPAAGPRYIISQPREPWEQGDSPLINEGPQPIVDPDGQLHIVYSANGSWNNKYCLADLRLRKGGNPTHVWDWYKSNGCLFGSHQDRMMKGWDATVYVDGPGHHTFALPDGDVNKSPSGQDHIPFAYHAVEKGTPYGWDKRSWFKGSFVWWGMTTYSRKDVPGDKENTGFSLKFFE